MAYSDPQSVTISGAAKSLPRTGMGPLTGTFNTSDGTVVLKVTHAYGRRNRHTVRLEHTKIAADPLTAANERYSMTAYLTVDVPLVGYTVAEAQAVCDGLFGWLTATSSANTAKALGGEI